MKNRLDSRIEQIPSEIWLKINAIDELKGQWTASATLSTAVLGRLKKSVLITSTGASTRIEGATLSDEDIEKMMRGLSVQKFADRDIQEVQGYYELLENVFAAWETTALSENTIKHFHGELLKHTNKDVEHRGQYKTQENKVHMVNDAGDSVGMLFDTTAAYLTPKEMNELVDWAIAALSDTRNHPLLVIANFVVEFLKVHPFVDGNGRLSRILTNLLLLQAGYAYVPYVSHEKLIEANKAEYYLALRRSQKTIGSNAEDITSWLHFFLDVLGEQTRMAVALLASDNVDQTLSQNQLAVLAYLRSVPDAAPAEIATATGILRTTINQIVNVLLGYQRVQRIGQGRATRYQAIER